MAPKRKAKPPPAKKKRMSLKERNKTSSLSSEYLQRISSSENSERDWDQRKSHPKRKKIMMKQVKKNRSELNTVWQNPYYRTELSSMKSQSEESQSTSLFSVDEMNSENTGGVKPMQVDNVAPHNDVDNFVPTPAGKKDDTKVPRMLSRKRPHAPPPVDSALVLVHNQLVMLESRFQKDLHDLEKSYVTNYYSPLFKLRNKLLEAAKVLNSVEPRSQHRNNDKKLNKTSSPKNLKPSAGPSGSAAPKSNYHLPSCELFECCAKVFLAETFGEEKWTGLAKMLCHISDAMYQSSHCNDCNSKPHKFWYYVFQRSEPILSGMLSVQDGELLSHLRDVRVNLFTAPWPGSPEFKSDLQVTRKHPPFLRTTLPKVSARHSGSLQSQISKSAESEANVINPSSRAQDLKEETSAPNDKSSTGNDMNTALGFEIEFEFYPNSLISNKILRKRYLIDYKPQDEDYIQVKQYKTFMNPQDGGADKKGLLCTSDGGDELSTDSENDDPVLKRRKGGKYHKTRSRTKKSHRYHRILDYRGPRLVAIEGSTIKWKKQKGKSEGHSKDLWGRPWMASSDLSAKASSSAESIGASPTSFFDFFGWNWDVYRNRIMTNDGTREIELNRDEIRIYVTRDYEIGSYLRDVVIPRAFAIYRSCKRINLQRNASPAESLLDSISQAGSVKKFKSSRTVKPLYPLNPTYVIPPPLTFPPPPPMQEMIVEQEPAILVEPNVELVRETQSPEPEVNLARSYDDVDDIMVNPVNTDEAQNDVQMDSVNEMQTGPTKPTTEMIDVGEIEDSRKKVSELVKNVNTIIHQANTHNAFHQPFVSSEPQPGAPLTCALDLQIIPEVRETSNPRVAESSSSPDSDIQSFGGGSYRGEQADDENNYRSDADPPSVSRAFEKIRGQFRRGSWKKVEHSAKAPVNPRKCLINDDDDDEIVSSVVEKEDRVKFNPGSPCPSDENAKVDESDLISSSAASDVQQDSATPSTSDYDISNPEFCPCDLHLLDEDTGWKKSRGRRKRNENTHILCKNSSDDIPLCSMGRDILKDESLRMDHLEDETKRRQLEFREVSSSDSEAPPPLHEVHSCKQQ